MVVLVYDWKLIKLLHSPSKGDFSVLLNRNIREKFLNQQNGKKGNAHTIYIVSTGTLSQNKIQNKLGC